MATSGVTTWDDTRNEIINDALIDVGAVGPGRSIPSHLLKMASDRLNRMIKYLQAEGMNRWLQVDETYSLSASDEVTGTDGEVYTCRKSHTSASANKPITGAEYADYWILSGSTGGVWATATSYSSIGDFDLATSVIGVEKAFYRRNKVDNPIEIVTYAQYMSEWSKYFEGEPWRMAIDWTATPRAYFYPQPNVTTDLIHLLEVREIEDFNAGGDNPDFPKKWNEVLVRGLTYRLAPAFGVSDQSIMRMKSEYEDVLNKAMGREMDQAAIHFITPAYTQTPYWVR